MLIYTTHGLRCYGSKPIPVYPRLGWEFSAVVRGAMAPVLPEGPELLREHTIWLFSPAVAHGWTGDGARAAEVTVFHFLFVPELIRRLAARFGGWLAVPLNAARRRRLRELSGQAERYWSQPQPGVTICHEHLLMELSLLIWEARVADRPEVFATPGRQRVDAALAWFAERMPENPGQDEVARAVGASAAHLRRHFHEVLDASPKQVFDQMRFQRAMQLMSDSQMKLESVGERCGFGSASAFSRAFKLKFGCSPAQWRGEPSKKNIRGPRRSG